MHGSTRLLLIVEDHATIRRLLERVLTYHGWDVETVSTVAEGLDRLAMHPDCVVLDLMLPDGDGEQVLRRVRDNHLPVRVVVTSASGDENRLAALRLLHPDAIVGKPIEINRLIRACEECPTPL